MIVALALGVVSMQLAGAHATLIASDPLAGGVVPTAPDEVRLTFDMELNSELSSMDVADPDGSTVAEGEADLDDPDRASMVADLPDDLQAGDYTVTWVVVEVDEDETHAVDGQHIFTIDPSATPAASSTVVIGAPEGTMEPVDDVADVDASDDGIGRGPLIVGGVTILVALAVVASIGRRRWWR